MMHLGISTLDFTPAKFDQSSSQDEKYIISSTGQYLVTWSFRNILRGRVNDYDVISLYSD
jgi:hypothetical protein